MFEYSGTVDDAQAIASARPADLLAATVPLLREQRALVARTVLAATRIGEVAFNEACAQMAGRNQMINRLPEKFAVREVSIQFGVTRSIAGQWLSLGQNLAALPAVTAAFLAGDLVEHRARIIAARLISLDDDALRADAEDAALELAAEPTPGTVLGEHIDALVIALAPDQAAQQRDVAAELHDVKLVSEAHGNWHLSGTIPLEDGLYLQARIRGMLSGCVCKNDPRTVGQQRVAAFRAIVHRRAAFSCLCRRSDCTADATTSADESPVEPTGGPLVQVVTDAPTLRNTEPVEPASVSHIPGYGPIDPAHARELTLRQGTRVQTLTRDDVLGVRASKPSRPRSTPFLNCRFKPIRRDRPAVGTPLDLSGHGAHTRPPPGALVYAPTPGLRRAIELTDHYCRGPHCAVPSSRCHLDHTVAFDHDDPLAGGWTVLANLAPLCLGCHQVKHLGVWVPTMHEGRIIVWTRIGTGQQVISRPDRY